MRACTQIKNPESLAARTPRTSVKIPATVECIPAIEQALSEGINVNITLLFAQEMYERVARAYIAGLTKYTSGGGDPSRLKRLAVRFSKPVLPGNDIVTTVCELGDGAYAFEATSAGATVIKDGRAEVAPA